MSGVEHVLASIDGALHDWTTSGDAMRWSPEPETAPPLQRQFTGRLGFPPPPRTAPPTLLILAGSVTLARASALDLGLPSSPRSGLWRAAGRYAAEELRAQSHVRVHVGYGYHQRPDVADLEWMLERIAARGGTVEWVGGHPSGRGGRAPAFTPEQEQETLLRGYVARGDAVLDGLAPGAEL